MILTVPCILLLLGVDLDYDKNKKSLFLLLELSLEIDDEYRQTHFLKGEKNGFVCRTKCFSG